MYGAVTALLVEVGKSVCSWLGQEAISPKQPIATTAKEGVNQAGIGRIGFYFEHGGAVAACQRLCRKGIGTGRINEAVPPEQCPSWAVPGINDYRGLWAFRSYKSGRLAALRRPKLVVVRAYSSVCGGVFRQRC